MKIKHFAGYGCVNAKKISTEVVHTINEWGELIDATKLKIKVTGDHEWGFVREAWDVYGLWHWLVKKFHKDCTDTDIMKIDIDSISFTECDYTFFIKKNN